MKKEDDISVEVLPSPGEIKIHLPLYYQIHQILCLKECVKSTKKQKQKIQNQTKQINPTQTKQKAEQLLCAVPHKRLILQSNWGVPRTMSGSQFQAVVSDLSKGAQL